MRLIPEALSYPHPIGFDTVSYAARIMSGVVWPHWTAFFSPWLLYAILVSAYRIVLGNPFFLLKLVGPTLFAINAAGIYYFADKALNWDGRNCLLASLFFVFQLSALRISWDLFKNTLGLGILLFALPWVHKTWTKKGFLCFFLLSLLVVFSHHYASVALFAVASLIMMNDFLKGNKTKVLRLMAAILPASTIFLTSVYLIVFPVSFNVNSNVIDVGDTIRQSPGTLFFLTDYLHVSDSVQSYRVYTDLFLHVFSLFTVLYLLCIPLILLGFFRDPILDGWSSLLLLGSFSVILTPFCALDLWNRWMFMLVYPFTFYAVNGIAKVLMPRVNEISTDIKWINVSKTAVFTLLLCTSLLGSAFVAFRQGDSGIIYTPTSIQYLPSSMLHNTVPLQDVEGTVEAFEWLNDHMNNGSCVLLHHTFIKWSELCLDEGNVIMYYVRDVELALCTASELGFDSIYLIWWNEDIGWYDLSTPKQFATTFSSNRISVFNYSLNGV